MVNPKHWDKMQSEKALRSTMEQYGLLPEDVIEIIEQYISRKKIWETPHIVSSSDGPCPGQLT